MRQQVELYQSVAMDLLRLDGSEPETFPDDPKALHLDIEHRFNAAQDLGKRWIALGPSGGARLHIQFHYYRVLLGQVAFILRLYFYAVPYITGDGEGHQDEAIDVVLLLKFELMGRFAALRDGPSLKPRHLQDVKGILEGFDHSAERKLKPLEPIVFGWGKSAPPVES